MQFKSWEGLRAKSCFQSLGGICSHVLLWPQKPLEGKGKALASVLWS